MHSAEPILTEFADYTLYFGLVLTPRFGGAYIDVVLPDLLHKTRTAFCFLLAAIADYHVRYSKVGDKLLQGIACETFGFHRVDSREMEVRGKDLSVFVTV